LLAAVLFPIVKLIAHCTAARGTPMNALLVTSYLIMVPVPKGAIEPTNPFVNAKVGDWVEYRIAVGLKPGEGQITDIPQMKIRTVVTVRTDKEVTLEVQMSGEVDAKKEQDKQIIDLTKPYDPLSFLDVGNKGKGKTQRIDDGREKINVGGKTYDCTWMTVKSGDPGIEEVKVWFCKDVPLTGMLRLEGKSSGIAIAIEMIGSGRK
jgi:hypothetical protein